MKRGAAVPLAVAIAAALATPAAHAEPRSQWVSWRAPGACPQQAALLAQTEAFLGHPLNQRDDRLQLDGIVQSDEERGYVVHLRVATSRGSQERDLAHRDCAELTEAAALIVALAIDPELVIPEKPAAAPATPPAPTSPPSAPPEPEPAPPTL